MTDRHDDLAKKAKDWMNGKGKRWSAQAKRWMVKGNDQDKTPATEKIADERPADSGSNN